jgi:hypothetical protein
VARIGSAQSWAGAKVDSMLKHRRTAKRDCPYRELDLFEVPRDVPEIGVRAGEIGTVSHIYGDCFFDVEIGREDGTSAGILDVRLEDGKPSIVGVTPFA